MTPNDIANMADFIAQAIHKEAAGEDESWGDLTENEQNEFRLIAHAGMGAHDAWLTVNHYKLVKLSRTEKRKVEKIGLVGVNGKPLGKVN